MTTIHLVSHTHWDREWYQTFQQFRLKLVHLIDGLLDLLENDRYFKYFMLDGQTIVLDDYLAMRPENEEKIRRYVRNGQLQIGPWHILPDEFLVSPEATIRNLLEGKRTCRNFGPRMPIGYIPDPFGHIGQMPQILHGFGIKTACVQRGLSDELCEFWWESPDGSRVFMAYLRDGYGNAAGLPISQPELFTAEVKRLCDSLLHHSNSNRHILFMNGTDHMEPHPGISKAINLVKRDLGSDKLVHSTLNEYMVSIQADLRKKSIPTVRGELRDCKRSHLLPGVLSTRMWIKQRNRMCENLLEKWVEPFSTFASTMPSGENLSPVVKHPSPIIRQAWRLLMECHPHDSICGCSIDQVHDEMKVRFDQVEQIGEEITRQNLETLAASIETNSILQHEEDSSAVHHSPTMALIVLNPHSFPQTDTVEAKVECVGKFDLLDGEGKAIPYQSQGLGSQELIHASLTPKELQSMYTAVHDGRVMGLSVLEIKVSRQGSTVFLVASVSEHQQPDLAAWQHGVADIEKLISNPEIESFQVRAISVDASRITFTADQVPGMGWKTFYISSRQKEPGKPVQVPVLARILLPLIKLPIVQKLMHRSKTVKLPCRIESDLLIVEAQKDGRLRVTEKLSGTIISGLNRFVDGGDTGDEYNYCPPAEDIVIVARLKSVSVTRDTTQQSMTLNLEIPTPIALAQDRKTRTQQKVVMKITTRVTIAKGVPRVDIRSTVENKAKDHRLRVHFPAPFSIQKAEHDGHFEVVERQVGIPEFDSTWIEHPRPEVPQRSYTSITNGYQRLTIANRGLPEVEVLQTATGNAEIALTLLRCVGWLSRDDFSNRKGHAGPFIETPGAQMLGTWTFDYSITLEKDVVRSQQHSYAFETPLRVMNTGVHAGMLSCTGSFLQCTPGEFFLSAIKEAEGGRGWVVRGYNRSNHEQKVTIRPWRPFNKADLLNLAEEKLGTLHPAKDGTISFNVRGYGIATVLFSY